MTGDNQIKTDRLNQVLKENRRLEENLQELSSLNQSTNMELNEKKLLKRDIEKVENEKEAIEKRHKEVALQLNGQINMLKEKLN